MMEKRECQCVADRINTYLASQLWMDFELCVLNGSEIVLRACLKNVNMPNRRVFCPLDGAIFP